MPRELVKPLLDIPYVAASEETGQPCREGHAGHAVEQIPLVQFFAPDTAPSRLAKPFVVAVITPAV